MLMDFEVELREMQDDDIQHIFRGLSHPEVIQYYGVSFATLEETLEQMDWYRKLKETGTGIWWKILTDKNEFVGACGFNNMEKDKAEIGFWILPEFWKEGYAFRSVTYILNYGFTVLNLKKIEAFVDSRNEACIRFMDKLEFVFVKCIPEYEIKDGNPIDLNYYIKVLQ